MPTGLYFNEGSIDKIFADLEGSSKPGVAVGIAIDGKPVYRKGFGLASFELPVSLSPSIRMRIGSITKQFTALAYALLCERGLATLDDPIGLYLPELHPISREATVRQVLSNTSGLRDATDYIIQSKSLDGKPISTETLLSIYRDIDDTNFPAGTSWMYNNGGFVLVSIIIERLTGKPLEECLSELIFSPLRMADTIFRRWDYLCTPNSASTHEALDDGSFRRGEYCGGIDYAGAGAIASTIDDMLRWLSNFRTRSIGSDATWDVIASPVMLNGRSANYGLGLRSYTHRDLHVLSHAGGGDGSNAQLIQVPSLNLDIVAMSNRSDVLGYVLVERVLDVMLSGGVVPASSSNRPIAEGCFRSPRTKTVVRLFGVNGRQFVSIDGMGAPGLPAERDEEGALRFRGPLSWFCRSVSLIGDQAKPSAIELDDYGNRDRLELVQQPPARQVQGVYKDSTGCILAIRGEEMRCASSFGTEQFTLNAIGNDVWETTKLGNGIPSSGVITHVSDGNELVFSTALNRARRFRAISSDVEAYWC